MGGGLGHRSCVAGGSEARQEAAITASLLVGAAVFGRAHQFIVRQPALIFFSAAYLAAASLTMGRSTLSSPVYQSD